jgi:hypothetical protein
MTEMQRWAMEYERGQWDISPNPEGQYVLAADAEAAIAAARQDMLAKCIALVEGTYTVSFVTLDADFQRAALVALRALSANADSDGNVSERRQEKP